MTYRSSITALIGLFAMGATLLLLSVATHAQDDDPGTEPRKGEVTVARWIYAGGKEGICFSEGFLTTVDRETDITVRRSLAAVTLESDDLYKHPFSVMTGEGDFKLSDKERERFKSYLDRGGFVLASAGCSDHVWANSFRKEIAIMYPDLKLEVIGMDHAIFKKGLYDIESIVPRKVTRDVHLYGLTQGGRLMLVFSPLGLNDTANAGGGCCCCGGNEIRNAKAINCNLLIYALTN